MKKILALLLLVLTLVLSLSSCANADDISRYADTAASMLEFNFYETLAITKPLTPRNVKDYVDDVITIETKDKNGESTGKITLYITENATAAEEAFKILEPDAVKNKQNIEVYGVDKVIVGNSKELLDILQTLPAGVEEMVVAEKKDKNGDVKDKITVYYCDRSNHAKDLYEYYSQNNAEGFEVGISSTRVFVGTKQALVDATTKNYFNQLYHTFIENDNYMLIVKGIGNTLIITAGALLIGVILGVITAVLKYYADGNPKLKVVNFICDLYVTVIRGIPITVLLLIFYFIILASANKMLIAIMAFGINSGAYMAELVRSGINAVDKGQMEAARSLGMSKWQAMRTIIFPQAVKNVLPAIGNECIALLKETSVAGYVAIEDLTRGANVIRNNTYDAFNPLILSALIYLVLVIVMTKLLSILERRLQKRGKR